MQVLVTAGAWQRDRRHPDGDAGACEIREREYGRWH